MSSSPGPENRQPRQSGSSGRASHDLKAPEPDQGDMDKLVEMIAQAERPLLICGGGVVRGGRAPAVPGVCREAGRPGGHHRHGRRRLPRGPSADHRHDRYARLPGLQCGLQRVRPAHRRGLPVLRPGGPPARTPSPARPRSSISTSTGRRSIRTSSPTTTSSVGPAGAGAAQRAAAPVPPPAWKERISSPCGSPVAEEGDKLHPQPDAGDHSGGGPHGTPSWPPTWASTRCGPSSTSISTIPASC